MEEARAHLVVFGRVQGVFFRHETQQTASGLGLKGMVRNRMDGSVEVIAEGDRKKIEQLISWCWQGPDMARVDNVEIGWEEPTGEYDAFKVGRTA
jgi:acylphosphatase